MVYLRSHFRHSRRLRIPPLDSLEELVAALSGIEARTAWLSAPAELAREIDVFGPASPGLFLMRGLKDALDPDGVFARGRFHGRI